jgi:hypothetical protein
MNRITHNNTNHPKVNTLVDNALLELQRSVLHILHSIVIDSWNDFNSGDMQPRTIAFPSFVSGKKFLLLFRIYLFIVI